jgi:hypothetical protein
VVSSDDNDNVRYIDPCAVSLPFTSHCRVSASGADRHARSTQQLHKTVSHAYPTLSPHAAHPTPVCSDAYSRDSFSTIAWLILAILLTLFFASTAYSFYRQLLDPTSFRAPRAPSDQVRLEHMHGQPYGGGYTPYPGFNAAPRYAPPPGAPPPGFGGYAAPPYEGGKLPGYASDLGHGGKDLDGDDKKDPDAFMEPQHFGAGPSEAELARPGYRV